MDKMKILVVGCGSIGKRHIGNLKALKAGEIIAFDVRGDRRKEVESLFGIESVSDMEEAWKRCPDAAMITSPTSMHVPLALQAANHGCHLFIEKPLSDRMEGVDELLSVVHEHNLVTLVGCNMRFHPGLIIVKKMLEDGAIGKVVAARVEVGQYLPDWHPQEDYRMSYSARSEMGGGVILDAIHEIDYIMWMLGEVDSISCFAGKISNLEIETEDTAAIMFRFRNGAIGEVHLDYVQRTYSRTCHIIGNEGTIRWDYSAGEVRLFSAKTHEWEIFCNPHGWMANQMYIDEMRHFLKCLSKEEEPTLDVFQGACVLKAALAAKASAKIGHVLDIRS